MKCVYCNNEFEKYDLRPYAINGGLTCFNCATGTSEREQIAKDALDTIFTNMGPVVILTDEGFKPAATIQ
jgi:hypothetical protein